NCAGNVLFGHYGLKVCRIEMIEENPCQEGHGKGLDEPIDDDGPHDPFGRFAYFFERFKIDLEHHGVNPRPDKDGNGDVDLIKRKLTESLNAITEEGAKPNSGRNTK